MPNTATNTYIYETELFIRLYKKIEIEKGITTKNSFVKNLETILEEDYNCYDAGARTLLRYYDKFALEKEVSCGMPSNDLKNNLAHYIGYTDYHEFMDSVKENTNKTFPLKKTTHNKLAKTTPTIPYKGIILTTILILLVIGIYVSLTFFKNNQRSMVWKTDHFEAFDYDINMMALGVHKITLFPYNEQAILSHKKVDVRCDDTINNIWYYKVNSENLEFFNFPGIHPVNEKTLKPLTEHMKQKYVCNVQQNNTLH